MKKTSLLFLALIALISSAFIKPMANEPKPITVVIDAGHGGSDFGATSNGTYEKVIVSQIAEKVKSLNVNKNIIVKLTRTSDELMTLDKRTEYINAIKPDLVLSLHVNSSTNHAKSGVEFYVSDKSPFFEKSSEIARKLNLALAKNNSLKVSDTKTAPFHIIKKSEAPAVIVELGYLTNDYDKKYLTDDNEQNEIAKNIVFFLSELK
ncbi:N-acetylmuramoyl-L-alanine amidase family protein [Flavobacterium laiguense]|uniref:N-acetylmuramoyl-L-alanine amidase n=1 Tax=Flavobacterium laiguense TaxID=2169409 RepID=A0A2U1JX74_9FLAO|nr:N-acetylmuramoyl-L-alanine amidase [Flavobacterium laiguense]PWA09544.1 N-acetylmuramoyl-L-alanine amidase [Flavobacterium laiguense]